MDFLFRAVILTASLFSQDLIALDLERGQGGEVQFSKGGSNDQGLENLLVTDREGGRHDQDLIENGDPEIDFGEEIAGEARRELPMTHLVCKPFVPNLMTLYVAPFGTWAGRRVLTKPEYAQHSVYTRYPVETAVQLELESRGFYSGHIDGSADSCRGAIAQYQEQSGLPVTGTITEDVLEALGVRGSLD